MNELCLLSLEWRKIPLKMQINQFLINRWLKNSTIGWRFLGISIAKLLQRLKLYFWWWLLIFYSSNVIRYIFTFKHSKRYWRNILSASTLVTPQPDDESLRASNFKLKLKFSLVYRLKYREWMSHGRKSIWIVLNFLNIYTQPRHILSRLSPAMFIVQVTMCEKFSQFLFYIFRICGSSFFRSHTRVCEFVFIT